MTLSDVVSKKGGISPTSALATRDVGAATGVDRRAKTPGESVARLRMFAGSPQGGMSSNARSESISSTRRMA